MSGSTWMRRMESALVGLIFLGAAGAGPQEGPGAWDGRLPSPATVSALTGIDFEILAVGRGSLRGDLDADGDVDLADYLTLVGCFTGADNPVEVACAAADLDRDRDVDLADLIVFQSRFTGALDVDPGPLGAGDLLSLTFTVRTATGELVALSDLDSVNILASGPSFNYQPLLERQRDVIEASVSNGDGTYSYTFPTPIPNAHLAPLNDSEFFGFEEGELTDRPLLPGTYTVGMWGYKNVTVDGQNVRDAGNATADFLLGGATRFQPREVVLQQNCLTCHNELRLHGDQRREVKLCLQCHTKGGEDRITEDPTKQTPGVTIAMDVMAHRIHRGRELRNVAATANSADPYHYEVIGFRDSVHDYSHVAFPYMPGGTGFNEQMRNCDVCHGGAAEDRQYFQRVTRRICNSCHDDVIYSDPNFGGASTRLNSNHPDVRAGLLTQDQLADPAYREVIPRMQRGYTDDSLCLECHRDARATHFPALRDPAEVPGVEAPKQIVGLRVVIDAVAGATGGDGAYFQPGDVPVVTFHLENDRGESVNIADMARVHALAAGPTGNYQHILPVDSTAFSLKGEGGVPSAGVGPFTYTFPQAVPMVYPPPFNDSDAFGFADGSGERQGQPLDAGTYTLALYAYRQFTVRGINYRETSPMTFVDINVGNEGPLVPYASIVTDASCNACHGDLRFHGNTRRGVQGCIMCHTSGAEDRAMGNTPQAPEPDTIDFRVMIHKIHYAQDLNLVQEGGTYDMVGFGNRVIDFSHGTTPISPGGVMQCRKCHGANSQWASPVERDDVRIWAKTCTSCHDGADTRAHVDARTVDGEELCKGCHGPGGFVSVDLVHQPRNLRETTPPVPVPTSFVGADVCRSCHTQTHAEWSETLHAHALDTLAAIGQDANGRCLACHTVGYDQEGGFVDRATTEHLAGVQCENCHGPGAPHISDPSDLSKRPSVDISADVCGQCHQGSHHPNFEQWSESGHAEINEVVTEDLLVGGFFVNSCGVCHSGDVFVAARINGETVPSDVFANATAEDLNAVTCAVCHDPHQRTGNAAMPDEGRDFQLRFPEAVFPEPSNTIADATNPDRFNLCGQCHHSRGRTWQTTSRAPHHSVQANVNVGEMPVPDGTAPLVAVRQSAHSFTAEQCATCHMYRKDFESEQAPAISGHSFTVNTEGCSAAGCHASAQTANSLMAGLQADVQAGLDRILARLGDPATWEYTAGGGPNAEGQAAIPDAIKQVRFLYHYILSDGSLGMHNPGYVRAMINRANALLDEFERGAAQSPVSASNPFTILGEMDL